jgi:hypothetical protein
VTDTWAPSSWRSKAAAQQPEWPDNGAVEQVEKRLATLPPLVFAGEARNLTAALAQVGDAGRRGGSDVVDQVAAERRQLEVADDLGVGGAGLGELPGDAAHLHGGHPGRVAEHDRHLQDHLERVPDGVGREGVEGLGAVTRLQQERLAGGHLAQVGGEAAGLAGEHQRGEGAQRLDDGVERAGVGPVGLLDGRAMAPRRR